MSDFNAIMAALAKSSKSPYQYGNRYGTNDPKANGFFGELPLPSGNVATEYSVGQTMNGNNVEMPSIVPTLNASELQSALIAANSGTQLSDAVYDKSLKYAQQRASQGQSPFWRLPEKQYTNPLSVQPVTNGSDALIAALRGR
jgi:hypothetical protein